RSVTQAVVTLTVPALKPIQLGVKHPSLKVTVNASRATAIALNLYNQKGTKLAGWRKHASRGRNAFVLLLPPKAAHPGRETLKIVVSGKPKAKVLSVVLR